MEQEKKNRERSTPYPSVPLQNAIEMVESLKKALGKGPYSRETVARALGHESLTGPAARKVAAMVHYGLLDRNGDAYYTNKLVEDILHPLSDDQKHAAIVKAAKSPRIFSKLIHQYRNQSIPSMMESILIREGISPNAAKEAAVTFKETLKFSGLDVNGVILDPEVDTLTKNQGETKKGFVETLGNPFDFSLGNKKDDPIQKYAFNDSGEGWGLAIKSTKPLTSAVRKLLVDLADLLSA